MPKISPIKGHNDSSFQVQSIPQRNVPKFKDQPSQPIIRTINTNLYDSVVPIYEVNYDPEFSKSPLASVEMSRRAKQTTYEPIVQIEPEEKSHVVKSMNYYEGEEQKCNWKTKLYWVGIIVGILAFVIGLYFLVDAILSRRTPSARTETNFQGQQSPGGQHIGGITPIYVNPIPYSTTTPSNSVSFAPIDKTPQLSYGATTYPSDLPNTQSPITKINSTKQPASTKPASVTLTPITTVSSMPQAQSDWKIDPLQNSIEPLNAYAKFPS